ncbi:MAG: hypothetical protein LBU04_03655 [Christensenellaceae bacterium]|jgi:hypothetical protein|nr:hypothetical protein [Christensenellaceae bacterium]
MFDILEYGKTADEDNKRPYKIVINEVADYNEDVAVDLVDVEYLLKNQKIL